MRINKLVPYICRGLLAYGPCCEYVIHYRNTSTERHVHLCLYIIISKVGIKHAMSIERLPTSAALKFLQQPFLTSLFTLCT